MVSAKEIKALAERLSKAEALVEAGAVFPFSGLPGYAVVRFEAGKEHCTCPDFQQRQGKAGQPCKHILAASIGTTGEAASESASRSRGRAAQQRHEGHIQAGGFEKDVSVEETDPDINDQIDAAYRTKYRRSASYVPPMISPEARATTLRLVPPATSTRVQRPRSS